MDKYIDKNILILGGGTSTLDTKWENLDYDFIWTCNDFYLEPRVYSKTIDLYLLSFQSDLSNKVLISKLKNSHTTVLYEYLHYRGKENTPEFKHFENTVGIPIIGGSLCDITKQQSPAAMSGAAFRLIRAALKTNAKKIYFAGFDGFNRDFTNIHAFTKHPGLKPTDHRKTYEGTDDSYVTVFTEAYKILAEQPGYERLQNLGERFDYNIGTPISKEYFPLTKEVYDKIR